MSLLPMYFITSVGDQKPNVKNQHHSIVKKIWNSIQITVAKTDCTFEKEL